MKYDILSGALELKNNTKKENILRVRQHKVIG